MNDWQVIETAPEDGTEVLLAYRLAEDEPHYETGLGFFDQVVEAAPAEDVADDEHLPRIGVWLVSSTNTRPAMFNQCYPEYWMPKPDPPAELIWDGGRWWTAAELTRKNTGE